MTEMLLYFKRVCSVGAKIYWPLLLTG